MCKGRLLLWHPAGRELKRSQPHHLHVRLHLFRNHHRHCAAGNPPSMRSSTLSSASIFIATQIHLIQILSRVAELRGLPSPSHVFGVGSDEVIDLLMRVCVAADGHDKILVTPPTYNMYGVGAQTNEVGVIKVNPEPTAEGGEGRKTGRFSLRVDEVLCRILLHCSSLVSISFATSYAGRDRPANQWLKNNRMYRSTARASYCEKSGRMTC